MLDIELRLKALEFASRIGGSHQQVLAAAAEIYKWLKMDIDKDREAFEKGRDAK